MWPDAFRLVKSLQSVKYDILIMQWEGRLLFCQVVACMFVFIAQVVANGCSVECTVDVIYSYRIMYFVCHIIIIIIAISGLTIWPIQDSWFFKDYLRKLKRLRILHITNSCSYLRVSHFAKPFSAYVATATEMRVGFKNYAAWKWKECNAADMINYLCLSLCSCI